MILKLAIWSLLGALVASAVPNAAAAAPGPYFSYRVPMAWGCLPPVHYVQQSLPYFSLYPPVYYGYPVARPYGHSPYAWPPRTVSAEIKPIQPLVARNPFVPREVIATPIPQRRIPTPQRMSNPYAR